MKKIFLATGNKKKIGEIKDIIESLNLDVEILSINDGIAIPEVEEDGETFEENSRKKAVEIAKYLNMITIADDSGLACDALDGKPGIHSARFGGVHGDDALNNKKLIELLNGVENRSARFICVISLAKPNGEVYSYRGEVLGRIVDTPAGSDGFGYDPHFYLDEYKKTFAEIPEVKKEISHRAKALKALAKDLKNIL